MEGPTFGLAAGVFAADIYYDEGGRCTGVWRLPV
jgi:hypothetical protein